MKYIILAVLTLSSILAYNYTHTTAYVASAYERTMARECESDLACMLGAAILEAQTVSCMQDRFLSTSNKTIETCLKKSIDSINSKNKE